MSVPLVHEIWKTIKASIEVGDVNEAAELLVNYMVDNDFDAKEIKSTFDREPEIQRALEFFTEVPEDSISASSYEDDYSDEEDEYEEW
jgi:hypothetical protein